MVNKPKSKPKSKPKPKQLSSAQLAQRRAAGRALAAKVEPDYFKWLGRWGGRAYMLQFELAFAQNYIFSPLPGGDSSQEAIERATNELRAHYREQALERYGDRPAKGQRVMLQIWEPKPEETKPTTRPQRKARKAKASPNLNPNPNTRSIPR